MSGITSRQFKYAVSFNYLIDVLGNLKVRLVRSETCVYKSTPQQNTIREILK